MPKQNILTGKTFRTLMQITASEDGKLPTDVLILPKGDWNTQSYGPMQVTEDHVNQIVANFKNNVRKLVPIDVDHDGGRAAGWFEDVYGADDGVHGKPAWTPYGQELLKNKEYRLFSPEWSFDYVDPEYGSRHGATLVAGSLTNRPLFKELPVLMANDGSNSEKGLTNQNSVMILLGSDKKSQTNMPTLNDILNKPVADRDAEDLKFLEAHKSELTDDQTKQLDTEKVDAEKAQADADEKAKADADAKAEQDKKDQEEKEAKEKAEAERKANEGKTVTITAQEHADFIKAKEANEKAQVELRRVATEKEISAFYANENGGKILAKANENGVLTNMVLSFNDSQKKSFFDFVQSLPDMKIAGEKGTSEEKDLTAKEKLSKLVDEALKASEKDGKPTLDRGQATKNVLAANEALANEYQKELN